MRKFCVTALMIVWGLCAIAAEKSQTIVCINGAKYYIHTVQTGETLYSLSKMYQVDEQTILVNNPSLAAGLKASTHIKIPVPQTKRENLSAKKLRKKFTIHVVSKGETLYGISRRYAIPINTIIEDNPELDPTHLKLDERVLIRKKQIGTEDEQGSMEQWNQYKDQLNSVAPDSIHYHVVAKGETFYSISHRYGISEQQLGALNGGLKPQDLKAGSMIRVVAETREEQAPTQDVDSVEVSLSERATQEVPQVVFMAHRHDEPIKVALLLPVAIGKEVNHNYLDFYQGFLMGLDRVKYQKGSSVDLRLYNTERSEEKIQEILSSEEFKGTQLIVGPVYESGLYPVIRYAEQHEIPVVSPLAQVDTNSDVLFQMAPHKQFKYEKVLDLFEADKTVTLIYGRNTDAEFEQEIMTLIGNRPYKRFQYKYEHASSQGKVSSSADLSPLLENKDDNTIVVMADNELDVDRILSALASANTNIVARGNTPPRFKVLGNARWNRYNNIDRAVWFKDNVTFVSSYHAKRDHDTIQLYDKNYLKNFGNLPTHYSYRGYDAAVIFVSAMFDDIEYDLENKRYTPLQTTYLFEQHEGKQTHSNGNWMRVNYNKDFTITIE